MDFKPIISGSEDKFVIVAGPCSAENEEQVLTTAKALSKYSQVGYFRAGVWKPRTHPGSFEGVGKTGLKWLQKAKKQTGLKVGTEVVTAMHVEQALTSGMDMLWIGARTTVNPFLVEEIATAVRGADIPILVKNPLNPDIDLWIGAIERFYRNGITQIAAVHRGFSSYYKGAYRNEPFWEIVFELRRRFPDLPIITDPSHLTGNSRFVTEMSQKAIDLEADGLMIEVHPRPEQALTDPFQQIDLNEFSNLIQTLIYRKQDKEMPSGDIIHLRKKIDDIDANIIQLLSRRMNAVQEIGSLKHRNELTILQKERWNIVVESWIRLGEAEGLKHEFLLKILQDIHEESLKIQSKIFKQRNDDMENNSL